MKLYSLFIIFFAFIITRNDVHDKKFIEHGKKKEFKSLAIFEHGNGTLIHERWVITAEHVTIGVLPGSEVLIDGKIYIVDKVVPYLQQKVESPFEVKDLALVRLNESVSSVKPSGILNSAPTNGEIIHIVGNGRIGDGLSRPTKSDGQILGATNKIDSINHLFIEFDFDSPNQKDATDLEGISGLGDSGGPAFINRGGNYYLAGVSSFQQSPSENTPSGYYGSKEFYVNVFSFKEWISSVIAEKKYFETEIDNQRVVVEIQESSLKALNGNALDSQKLIENEKKIREEYESLLSEKQEAANKLPRFLLFIQNIALIEELIDSPQPVAFKLSGNELVINDKKVSAKSHQSVLNLYLNEFGEKLVGDSNIVYDPTE